MSTLSFRASGDQVRIEAEVQDNLQGKKMTEENEGKEEVGRVQVEHL